MRSIDFIVFYSLGFGVGRKRKKNVRQFNESAADFAKENYINRIDRTQNAKSVRFVDTHTHTQIHVGGGNGGGSNEKKKTKFKAAAIGPIRFSRISTVEMFVQSAPSVHLISVVFAIFIVAAIDDSAFAENCPATIENECKRCTRHSFYGRGE